mgnify:CR=1 FL=1
MGRIHAAIFSFAAGVMPPMPMFGHSMRGVSQGHNHRAAWSCASPVLSMMYWSTIRAGKRGDSARSRRSAGVGPVGCAEWQPQVARPISSAYGCRRPVLVLTGLHLLASEASMPPYRARDLSSDTTAHAMRPAWLGHRNTALGLPRDRKERSFSVSSCLYSKNPRSSWRETSALAAPYFRRGLPYGTATRTGHPGAFQLSACLRTQHLVVFKPERCGSFFNITFAIHNVPLGYSLFGSLR